MSSRRLLPCLSLLTSLSLAGYFSGYPSRGALATTHQTTHQDDIPSTIAVAPTDLNSTQFRGGPGRFGAPRDEGKTHAGVDIVANQSSTDKSLYRVMAMHDGKVAYAHFNGLGVAGGYGFTVVIDHGDGFYSLYAHLATEASKGLVKLGNDVKAGQVIGYIFDPATNEHASGNAESKDVAKWDKLQTHIELFTAPTGRSSTGAIAPLRAGGVLVDPTARLKALGYKG